MTSITVNKKQKIGSYPEQKQKVLTASNQIVASQLNEIIKVGAKLVKETGEGTVSFDLNLDGAAVETTTSSYSTNNLIFKKNNKDLDRVCDMFSPAFEFDHDQIIPQQNKFYPFSSEFGGLVVFDFLSGTPTIENNKIKFASADSVGMSSSVYPNGFFQHKGDFTLSFCLKTVCDQQQNTLINFSGSFSIYGISIGIKKNFLFLNSGEIYHYVPLFLGQNRQATFICSVRFSQTNSLQPYLDIFLNGHVVYSFYLSETAKSYGFGGLLTIGNVSNTCNWELFSISAATRALTNWECVQYAHAKSERYSISLLKFKDPAQLVYNFDGIITGANGRVQSVEINSDFGQFSLTPTTIDYPHFSSTTPYRLNIGPEIALSGNVEFESLCLVIKFLVQKPVMNMSSFTLFTLNKSSLTGRLECQCQVSTNFEVSCLLFFNNQLLVTITKQVETINGEMTLALWSFSGHGFMSLTNNLTTFKIFPFNWLSSVLTIELGEQNNTDSFAIAHLAWYMPHFNSVQNLETEIQNLNQIYQTPVTDRRLQILS